MARPSRFSPEVRERAVRMVFEHAQDARVAVGGDHLDRREDRVRGRDAAQLGAAGRAGRRPAARADDGRAGAAQAARARERRAAARERDPAAGVGVFREGGARPPSEVMVALHRRPPGDVRGRADLRGPADRPVAVRRAQGPGARSPARGGTSGWASTSIPCFAPGLTQCCGHARPA